MNWLKKSKNVFIALITIFSIQSVLAQIGAWDPEAESNCEETIKAFKDKNGKFDAYFKEAYGYAIFPSIGKGAIGIGGAHGKGLVYEQSEIIGETKMTQIIRGKEPMNEWRTQVLEREHLSVISLKSMADLIVNKNYEIVAANGKFKQLFK